MTTEILHAYLEGTHIGTFTRDSGGIGFEYDDSTQEATPISLSLPRDIIHHGGAALAYLDNLLPDRADVRQRWARERGLPDAEPFTLLAAYGEDVAGAVVLSQDDSLPARDPEPLVEATQEDIAARIATLRREETSWLDPRSKPRLSVAGAQSKFTLAQVGETWFWPTFELPSTHIMKPPSRRHRKIELFEMAALDFARHIGIRSSRSEVKSFFGEQTFATLRWDRAGDLRLHAEDLNQSLGSGTESKYNVSAIEVASFLNSYNMAYEFVEQLAFNTALGNADAHAKNYSVLLSGKQVRLAPLYDSLPTYFYPTYETSLSMPIAGARYPVDVTDRKWTTFAQEADLDVDTVRSIAHQVTSNVRDEYEPFFAPHFSADSARMKLISQHIKNLSRSLQGS